MRRLAALLLLAACSSPPTEDAPLTGGAIAPDGLDGFNSIVSVGPRVLLAGQPTPAGLANARDSGVTVVINVRPDSEMTFDERAVVQGLHMAYVSIPFTVDTLNDAKVRAFIETIRDLRRREGEADRVLAHGNTGDRVAALWALYEITDGKVPPEAAVARARQAGLTSAELVGYIGEYARRIGAW
ncbi:MAG TPA: sulfur transferase domain-containing protein [Planctomycetota bacterium]|nr:sulfur transferase domain-containing protein [Planctomycetota bacterium]